MDAALFLEQFGHLADSPCGVGKLRNLILELAVRGQLVPQNPDEEPAIETFNKLGLNAREEFDGIINSPRGWILIKLDRVVEVKGGKRIPKGHILLDSPTPYIYIRVTDMKNGTVNTEGLKYISSETRRLISNYTISSNDLYITIAGTIGSVGFIPQVLNDMNLTENAAKITIINSNILKDRYLFYALNSQMLQMQFQEKFNQMAQPKLALRSIRDSFIPLPPLAEQERIVAKVDELMALCDQLEAQQTERNHLRERAAKSTLFHLTDAPTRSEARQYWHYAEQHFPHLFDRSATVADLRATILQLAVQGRLVPQNPDDEPASELLKRIDAEKKRLIKAGELKASAPLPPIREDEIPYPVPDGWAWAKSGNISLSIQYGFTASANSNISQPKMLRITDIQNNYVNWDSVPGCIIEEDKIPQFKLQSGDILIARTGGTIGKTYLIKDVVVDAVFASYLIRIRFPKNIEPQYAKYFLESPLYWQQVTEKSKGTGQPNINGTSLSQLLIPLPPLAEQQRIVAKVDELMALCDQLEAEADARQALAGRLFDSIVYHLFAGER